MEFESTNSVAGLRLLPARSARGVVSKGNIMTNTYSLTSTCDTCEKPSVATYSNGDGTTEKACGYHDYLKTRIVLICNDCERQAYVACRCED